MKTIGAISLIVLLLFTGIRVSVATHYCCGHVAGTKVSLTGAQATCGMENEEAPVSHQEIISTHCCDNVMSSYSFSNNYFPTFYNYDNFDAKAVISFIVPSDVISFAEPVIIISNRDGSPPGNQFPDDVLLSSICVFRI